MKIDGRTLDHKSLEHLRITACSQFTFPNTGWLLSTKSPDLNLFILYLGDIVKEYGTAP